MLKQKWAKLHHEFFFIAFVNATVYYFYITKYGNKSSEAILSSMCLGYYKHTIV